MSSFSQIAVMGLSGLVKNMISMINNKTSSKEDMESMMKKIVHECLAEQEKKNTTEMNSVLHEMMALLQESIRRPTEEHQYSFMHEMLALLRESIRRPTEECQCSELCDMTKEMNVEKEKEEASQKAKEEIIRELIKALADISDNPKDNSCQMQEDRRGNDRGNQFRGNRNRGHSNHRGTVMQFLDGRNDRDQSYRNNRQHSEGQGNFRGRGNFHRERNFTRNDFHQRGNGQNNASFVDLTNFKYGRNVNQMQDGAYALPQDLSAEERPFRGEPYQHNGPPGAGQFRSTNTDPIADHSSKFSQDHGRNEQRQYFHNQKFRGGQKKFQHHGNLHNKAIVNVIIDGKPYIADEKGKKKNKKKQNNKKGKKPDKNAPQISVVDSNDISSGSEGETKANQESQNFKLLLGGELKEEYIAEIKDLNAEVRNVIQITIVGDETISYHPKTVGELINFKKKHPNCQTLIIDKSEVKEC